MKLVWFLNECEENNKLFKTKEIIKLSYIYKTIDHNWVHYKMMKHTSIFSQLYLFNTIMCTHVKVNHKYISPNQGLNRVNIQSM